MRNIITMAKKATPNIDYMLQMAKDYIDGTGNPLDFELDYGYEFEKRYRKMEKGEQGADRGDL